MDTNRHSGKVVVVTGGSSGIGKEIARTFLSQGAFVELVGLDEGELIETQKEFGEKCGYKVHDVTNTEYAKNVIESIYNKHDRIDVLVNNAGIHQKKSTEEMSVAEFNKMLNVHVTGAFSLVSEVLPIMKKQNSGNIIFMASMAAIIGLPEVISYAAAKSAYVGMVRSLTSEVAGWNIRVNAIAPGWIDTPLLRKALADNKDRAQKILERTPMNKFGDSEDIANATSFLCSEEAKFITGVLLPVDGGASIGF
ncbi:SDR family NAD(P)-dependent oxidoreductase [Aestuariivivens sp. NBU2969]|uniref:SDR family NAD(P)-dependent oxidoreductase n=1 Tax=Aestuariivivens sp. NBU2969 TaxID=2873267 RepID=UPI001CBFE93B|nr:SDR family NAD(P)-dependent oxidoreductase [Aestuariivivens sp. NBU2969]